MLQFFLNNLFNLVLKFVSFSEIIIKCVLITTLVTKNTFGTTQVSTFNKL